MHSSQTHTPPFDPDESLPRLVANINDPDTVVVDESLKAMEAFSRVDKFKTAIITHSMSDELSKSLSLQLNRAAEEIQARQQQQVVPQQAEDEELKKVQDRAKSASKMLSILSSRPERLAEIIRSDAVRGFSLLLTSNVDRLMIYACTTLHNILIVNDQV